MEGWLAAVIAGVAALLIEFTRRALRRDHSQVLGHILHLHKKVDDGFEQNTKDHEYMIGRVTGVEKKIDDHLEEHRK